MNPVLGFVIMMILDVTLGNVDAPIINEFPLCMECEFIEYQDDETGLGVIGKVINTSVDENVMNGDKVDIKY